MLVGCIVGILAFALAIWLAASGKISSQNADVEVLPASASKNEQEKGPLPNKMKLEEPTQSPFFTVLPWRTTSERQSMGVLEFCSDGNETFGYGLLGK